MNIINSPGAYWVVVKKQNNVLVSSSNFPEQGTEPQYITETEDSVQYDQTIEISSMEHQYVIETGDSEPTEISIADEPEYIIEEEPECSLEEEAENTIDEEEVEYYVEEESQPTVKKSRRYRLDPFWTKNKTRVLLGICANDKYRNWDPKDVEMWKEIAPIIGTTPDICYRRYLGLKSTYIRLSKRILSGKTVKWFWFSLCEEVFKDDKFINEDLKETWDDDKIQRLLFMYMELFDKVSNRNYEERKQCWSHIASSLRTTELNCIRKFTELRRTYISILKRNQRTGTEVKWPYHLFFKKIFRDGIRFRDKWNNHKVKQLIFAFMERKHKFANPKYARKDLWNEISSIVGEDAKECSNKFSTLKGTYMRHKEMENSRQCMTTKWKYYNYFEIMNRDHCLKFEDDQFLTKKKGDKKVIQMLEFYIQNIDKFKNPLIPNKSLWKQIGPELKLDCDVLEKKFRNLKTSYIRILDQQRKTGKATQWPYYSYFEQISAKTKTLKGITTKKQKESTNEKCSREDDQSSEAFDDITTKKQEVSTNEEDSSSEDDQFFKKKTKVDKKVIQILEYYIKNKDKFKNKKITKKSLWKQIGPKLNLTSSELDRKFRNLKHSYIRILDQQRKNGKPSSWPYYSYFEQICGKTEALDGITTKKQKLSTNLEHVMSRKVKKLASSEQDCQVINNKFERLMQGVEESNKIQRERNEILWALIGRNK